MLPLLVTIATLLNALFAGLAVVLWRRALPSTAQAKRLTSCEAEIAALLLSNAKLLDAVKRVSNRIAVSEHRSRKDGSEDGQSLDIPFGDKAALRARFGAQAAQLASRFKG